MTNDNGHEFPSNATGDALRKMIADGDLLESERGIDYSIIFSDIVSSFEFCMNRRIEELFTVCNIEKRDNILDVTITIPMVPSYDAITNMEELIEEIAGPLGGVNDGWGCFAVN